uniref:Uncharacterized protein n=1 Tax=Oryza brachyantha TaxID=4533 RepID=J3MNT7_ORYBR
MRRVPSNSELDSALLPFAFRSHLTFYNPYCLHCTSNIMKNETVSGNLGNLVLNFASSECLMQLFCTTSTDGEICYFVIVKCEFRLLCHFGFGFCTDDAHMCESQAIIISVKLRKNLNSYL